ELRVYPANQNQRVVVVGRDVLVATTALRGSSCTYTLQARDPATNDTLWTRTGFNANTVSDLGCDQRSDPKGAGAVVLATDTPGGDVRVSGRPGTVRCRARAGRHVIAPEGTTA